MTPHLIFDGYNLIYSKTFSDKYRSRDNSLEAKRERLVYLVAKHIKGKNLRATIVFDSPNYYLRPPPRGNSRKISVLFASPSENADERIVKLALKARPRSSITVISSDEAHIGGFLRGCGINVINTEDFWNRIYKTSKTPADDEGQEKPRSVSKEDIAYWERVFSENNGKQTE